MLTLSKIPESMSAQITTDFFDGISMRDIEKKYNLTSWTVKRLMESLKEKGLFEKRYSHLKQWAKVNTGKKIGHLIILNKIKQRKDRQHYVQCKCDCGSIKYIRISSLCCKPFRKICNPTCPFREKHGETGSILYTRWQSMKQRCSNKKHQYYHVWGGKGITVCKEWIEYDGFKRWALKNGFKNNLSLDRIDPDKGYNPENCQWIPMIENVKKSFKDRELKLKNLQDKILYLEEKIFNLTKKLNKYEK